MRQIHRKRRELTATAQSGRREDYPSRGCSNWLRFRADDRGERSEWSCSDTPAWTRIGIRAPLERAVRENCPRESAGRTGAGVRPIQAARHRDSLILNSFILDSFILDPIILDPIILDPINYGPIN